ncbi:C-C motif chemokine 36.1 [Myripristis murdjan]|uniref:C-C motif chemokine 3-like n=1 Tax=Myripristis murdjan TaxID=586833 RepID=A0A667XUM3_9TELE|nr:C-C motif chemokine 3-like [Myripristis murdjan]
MPSSQVLLLCILGAALFSTVLANNGISPEDCCFAFYPRRVNKNLIASYYLTDQRCTRTGAIIVTKRGKHICVDPNLSWVQGIMKLLDERGF